MSLYLFLLAWVSAWAGTLQVEVLDVGQGDSILVRTPEGKTVLIDGGTGRRNVPAMLQRRQISSVDLIINTHAHADHLGGLDEVLEAMPVRVYVDPGMPHTTETYKKVIQLVEDKGVQYKAVRGGQVFRFDDGITLTVLGPHDPLLAGTRSDLNSNSVITRLDHGEICFLLMGDAELETEHRVLEHGLGHCDVLKVAHHGSAYATSNPFLEAVQPEWAAISVGRNNRYKHPAPGTMKRLEKSGAKVLRTDLHGRILFESNGKKVKVSVSRTGPEVELPPGVAHKSVDRLPAAAAATPETPAERTGPAAGARPALTSLPTGPRRAAATDGTPPTPAPSPTGGKVNLNTATQAELVRVPGIGPARAEAILRYRETHGPFATVEAADAVPGIGPAMLKQLVQHTTVE